MMQDSLEQLQELQNSPALSIINLSETVTVNAFNNGQKRSSDVSADAYDDVTPASLEADLAHYKDLFSKLRFSYIEQVTKEKFLAAITSDPPIFVEAAESAELEATILQSKASLKAQKAEVADLILSLKQRGQELSSRYEVVKLQSIQAQEIPAQIARLEEEIASLQAAQPSPSTEAHLSLGLEPTLSLLAAREAEVAALDAQLASLQATLPRRTRELERLEAELKPLESQKMGVVAVAKEAKRRREEGAGNVDDLEVRGRWLRASEGALRSVLGVEG